MLKTNSYPIISIVRFIKLNPVSVSCIYELFHFSFPSPLFITNIFIVTDNYSTAIKILQLENTTGGGVMTVKDINFERISKKLRDVRISKGYSQDYVARKADVNTSHICNIENNRVKVSLSTLIQICNALNITVDYILADEYNNPVTAIEHELLNEFRLCSESTQKQVIKIVKALK